MTTFVSTVSWKGSPAPRITDIQERVSTRSRELRDAGLHSVIYLPDGPDDGGPAAVLITSCVDDAAVEQLAAELCPAATVVRVSTIDADAAAIPAWLGVEDRSLRPDPYLEALLADVMGPAGNGLRAVRTRATATPAQRRARAARPDRRSA